MKKITKQWIDLAKSDILCSKNSLSDNFLTNIVLFIPVRLLKNVLKIFMITLLIFLKKIKRIIKLSIENYTVQGALPFRTIFVIFFIFEINVFGQQTITQDIRGSVVDASSGSPLPGANIILLNTNPPVGTSSDENGNFILKNVPVGRQSLKVSYVGYKSLIINDLIVGSAKQVVLKIKLEENVTTVGEVEVVAGQRKDRAINPMALVSARAFTVEETNRYAGSYGDPARMAANYAGVVMSRDNRNDIVVRGNSPAGIQYRVDGIEITNPNHYGAMGTTGGPVTILNTNLLTNSDFLTGAFPAQYGNAISGVFDLKMKVGNSQKREYWGQLGWNGLEFGLEGPFYKKSNSSYIAAYRYSFTDILKRMGINLPEVARYQDLSFKINIPTKKSGIFSFTGIGGTSSIKIAESGKKKEEWTFPTHGEDINTGSSLGAFGISHSYFFTPGMNIKTILSVVASEVRTRVDTFTLQNQKPFLWAGENSKEFKYTLSSVLSKKINAKNRFDIGIQADMYNVDYADSQYYFNRYKHFTGIRTNFNSLQAFTQWEYKFNNKLTSSAGLHYLLFTLNNSYSIEPRFGLRWEMNSVQSLNFGFGLLSEEQPHMMYFVQTLLSDGKYALTNENMGLSKSLQFILGYNRLLTENLRLKIETYYQSLYNIPVTPDIPQYSLLNAGTDFYIERQDRLINAGTGENYGLEFTMEKFFHRNYFFLFTASLFQSKYRGYDKVLRNTAYNGNFVLNAVGGYEVPVGKMKNRTLIFGLRATWSGGRPYVPFDKEETIKQGRPVYDWNNAYQEKYPDYFRSSFRFGMRKNGKKISTELVFDLQYRANYTYVYLYQIDVTTGEVVQTFKMGFYPMTTVRIMF